MTATNYSGQAFNFNASLTATSLIKSGGTSSQFLKADGSVDSSLYITTALTRYPVADANYTVSTTLSCIVAYTSITVSRTVTLPAATTAGQIIWVVDESGALSPTISITIQRAGSDTIEGQTSLVLTGQYAALCLESSGSGKWTTLTYEELPTVLSDANGTVSVREDVVVMMNTITAARTIALPAATTTGQRIVVADLSGSCSATNTITINRAGADTINGATSYVLSSPYAFVILKANGSNKWVASGNYANVGQTFYLGTTSIAINRASAAIVLTGITSIDGAAATTGITNDAATATTCYPTWVTANTGNLPQKTTSGTFTWVPSTGVLTAPVITASTNFVAQGFSAVANSFNLSATSGTTIVTGSGSSYDFAIRNVGGTYVMNVPTGTNNVTFYANLTATTLYGAAFVSNGNVGAVAGSFAFTAGNGIELWGKTGSTNDFVLKNNAGTAVLSLLTGTTNVIFGGYLGIGMTPATKFEIAPDNSTTLGLVFAAMTAYTASRFGITSQNSDGVAIGVTTGISIGLNAFGVGFTTAGITTASDGTLDTGISRNTAGVIEINSGTKGTYRDLLVRTVTASGNVSALNTYTAGSSSSQVGYLITYDGTASGYALTFGANYSSPAVRTWLMQGGSSSGDHTLTIQNQGSGNFHIVMTKGNLTLSSGSFTGSGSGLTSNTVPKASIVNMTQAALLGANAAGAVGEITLGTGLSFSGSVLNSTGGSGTPNWRLRRRL